jgi:hypothetical protein
MKIPENKETFDTEIGTYWFDEDGMLNSLSKSPTRTVANTKANFELVKRITNNQKVCHLVYLTNSKKPDKATIDFVNSELPKVYKAMAMISKSGVGEIIMNVLFKFMKPVIPMKTFTDEKEARKWLKQYL